MTDLISLPEESAFPPKPVVDADNNTISRSVLSILFFIVAFYLVFDKELEYVLMLVGVLLIHEAGHFVAMRFFNYKDVKMFFIPLLGAMVTGEKHEVSQKQRAIVLVAGPFPGIILGLAAYFIGVKFQLPRLLALGNLFTFINLFNLFPIKPLDGGNLMETLFFSKSDTLQKVFMVLSALVMAAFAIYSESYLLLIVPLIFFGYLSTQSSVKKVKAALDAQGIDYNKPFEELTDREYWLSRDAVVSNIRMFKNIPVGEYVVSKNEKPLISQIKALATAKYIADLSGWGKALFIVLWLVFIILPVIGFAVALLANVNLFKTTF